MVLPVYIPVSGVYDFQFLHILTHSVWSFYLILTFLIGKEGVATHSSTFAWRIPWTEEPGRLQSTKSCKELDMTE